MMGQIEEKIEELERKIDNINSSFDKLQDILLYNSSLNEIGIDNNENKNFLCELTSKSNQGMNHFLIERPMDCGFTEFCTKRVEKAINQIQRTFILNGLESALEAANFHLNGAKKEALTITEKIPTCKEFCYNNVILLFENIINLMKNTGWGKLKDFPKLDVSKPENWINKYSENELSNLLSPLNNPFRLKILRVLTKGSKSFSQIERETRIKTNLLFHLEKLIKANYIIKEQKRGKWKYMIHLSGLKALRLINELKNEIN